MSDCCPSDGALTCEIDALKVLVTADSEDSIQFNLFDYFPNPLTFPLPNYPSFPSSHANSFRFRSLNIKQMPDATGRRRRPSSTQYRRTHPTRTTPLNFDMNLLASILGAR